MTTADFAARAAQRDPWADSEPVDVGETYLDRLRAALVDSAGLDSIPEPAPLVDGVIYRDSLAWLQGRRGNGKSFVALDIAGCVASGVPWHGRPTAQGDVLYMAAEGVSGMRWRVRAWEQAMAAPMAGVTFLPLPVQAGVLEQWAALIQLAGELQPALIVIDTQARVTVGQDENAAADMGRFVDALESLRRASGACVMPIHHVGRSGEHMRGSTALEGAATSIIAVAKEDDQLTISCPKQKDGEEFHDFTLRMIPVGQSVTLIESDGRQRHSTAALRTGAAWWAIFGSEIVSATRLVDAGVAEKSTLYRHVKALATAGFVTTKQSGSRTHYRLITNPDPGGAL